MVAGQGNRRSTGHVYVLSNPAMPGLCKIGRARDVGTRRRALSVGTMVPDDFIIEAVYASDDPDRLERHIHMYFVNFRYNERKEFFKINIDRVRRYISFNGGYDADNCFWTSFPSQPLSPRSWRGDSQQIKFCEM